MEMELTQSQHLDLLNAAASAKPSKMTMLTKTTLIKGRLALGKTFSDILVHYSDGIEQENISTSIKCPTGITLGVILQGKIAFSLDNKDFELSADKHSPICFAYNLSHNSLWKRNFIANNHVIKVVVSLPNYWLNQRFLNNDAGNHDLNPCIQSLLCSHQKLIHCQANHPCVDSSQRIINSQQQQLSNIELESIALAFIAAHLRNLNPYLAQPLLPEQYINPEALKIRAYIEQHIIQSHPPIQPNLTRIAYDLAISVSSAQRLFKANFGRTIIDYVRCRRLELAREQLNKKVSIGEVSYQAGYKHSSNFSLAFKKMFGITPGEV